MFAFQLVAGLVMTRSRLALRSSASARPPGTIAQVDRPRGSADLYLAILGHVGLVLRHQLVPGDGLPWRMLRRRWQPPSIRP
jgi:hypothetical protein